MAISNYIPSSRISQSGVCTSTTRPASPYEGQMIYETDTNRVLVYDNAAWVMIADTDQPPGLQLVKTQTIGTAVSSETVSDAFSADYDNYLVVINGGTASGLDWLELQFSGSTGTTYAWATFGNLWGTGGGVLSSTNVSKIRIGTHDTTNYGVTATIIAPFLADEKLVYSQGSGNQYFSNCNGRDTSAVSRTGFVLTSAGAGNTFSGGTIRVYGYRNA